MWMCVCSHTLYIVWPFYKTFLLSEHWWEQCSVLAISHPTLGLKLLSIMSMIWVLQHVTSYFQWGRTKIPSSLLSPKSEDAPKQKVGLLLMTDIIFSSVTLVLLFEKNFPLWNLMTRDTILLVVAQCNKSTSNILINRICCSIHRCHSIYQKQKL